VTLILALKELWRRRLLVAAAAVASALVAALVVYDVSLAPPSLSKRGHVEATGSIEILVDSAKSPIADVGRDLEPLTARAGVFARYIAGGNVIGRIARDTGIPADQIEVAGPVPLPGEAAGAGAPPPHLLPYGIEIVQRDALPILNVATRAPTVAEARELADAAPAAVRQIVTSIQQQQGIPENKRVTFRVLGPAQASPVAEALGAKVGLLIFTFLFALLLLLILGAPRLAAAWRAAETEPGGTQEQPPLRVAPAPSPRQPGDPAAARALASASIAAADEVMERAQLETPASPRPGDG
jgi:hypothetical protein